VASVATSIDGRSFSFQAPLTDLTLEVGGYVSVGHGSDGQVGQVLSLELQHLDSTELVLTHPAEGPARRVPVAIGSGTLLGPGAPFVDAPLRPASTDEIGRWLEANASRHAALEIGELLLAPGLPARLDAAGFDRHTFLCGQSGSGKTYSLGVVLERLLLETELRIVILDPNSDYVRLAQGRAGADAALADRYRQLATGIAVRRAASAGGPPLHLRFGELDPRCQAALLRLDPVADRQEYAALTRILEGDEQGRPLVAGLGDLADSELAGAHELGMRASNLGVLDWEIWEHGAGGSLVPLLSEPDWRCLVVDLGSLNTPDEQAVVSEAVLATLWRLRRQRRPVLIVIDEAHNICPQRPEDPVTALATRQAVQIAAEGRKFGLYLFVSTQRPQKVHENVLSQCDNLLLMRMNSQADLAYLAESFSFVPTGLLGQASHFGLGAALVAGKISPQPALVRFGARVSEEGGADVSAGWADPAPG